MYFITTFEKLPKEITWDSFCELFGDIRTVGYYDSLDSATHVVTTNKYDLFETCYWYCIIEEVEEGIYPDCPSKRLYKYNIDNDTYEEFALPDFMACDYQIVFKLCRIG